MSKPASLREITLDVRRRIKRSEKALASYVTDINAQVEEKLKKRAFVAGFEAEIEEDLAAYKRESDYIKREFVLEVDRRLEDQSQYRATRMHHKREISRLLPAWVVTLNTARESCAAIGHNDKLYWRTAAVRLLKQSVQESHLDEFAHETRLKLNKLILNINTKKSQQVMDLLEKLKEEYISSREDAGSALGGHSVNFRDTDAKVDRENVPLPRSQWSQNLDGNSVLLQQSRSILTLDDDPEAPGFSDSYRTASATDAEPSWILDSMLDIPVSDSHQAAFSRTAAGRSKNIGAGDIYGGKKSKAFMNEPRQMQHIHSSISDIVRTGMILRFFANHGDIVAAWQHFLGYLQRQNRFYHFDIKSIRKYRTLTDYLNNTSLTTSDLESAKESRIENLGALNDQKDHADGPVSITGPTRQNRPSRKINPYNNESNKELYLLLMKAFKNSKDLNFENAWMIVKTMILYGLEPDIRLMNIMLRACERRSMWRRAIAILREMMHPSTAKESPCGGLMCEVEPNAHTFDILIACCRHAIDEPGEIFKILRTENFPTEYVNCKLPTVNMVMYYDDRRTLFFRLCYKAALCNAGNRVSGQAARDQARQAKDDSDRHKRFLSRCRKKRNAKNRIKSNCSKSLKLETMASLPDDSDGSQSDSPVRLPPIGPENSFDSTFVRSPNSNIAVDHSYNDAFSSFYEADVDDMSRASSHQDAFLIGSQATEISEDETSCDGSYGGAMSSPVGNAPFKIDDRSNKLGHKSFSSAVGSIGRKSKTSEFPFCSNIMNDFGGGGGMERAHEWNMLSSSVADSLPADSPARHRTGPSALSFENHLAKIIKDRSYNRYAKGSTVGGDVHTMSVSDVLRGGNSKIISPLAASYFSSTDDELKNLGDRRESQRNIQSVNSNNSSARLMELTSNSLLSNPSYLGRSVLNLTKLK